MKPKIPITAFVGGKSDVRVLAQSYADARVVRVNLLCGGLADEVGDDHRLWMDCAFDGFHDHLSARKKDNTRDWVQAYQGISCFDKMCTALPQRKPDQKLLNDFVGALLVKAMAVPKKRIATLLTIPQLPIRHKSPTWRVNTQLLQATQSWLDGISAKSKPHLVLPVVITHRDQYWTNSARAKIVKALTEAAATGVKTFWVVDRSLDDHCGQGPIENTMRRLILLHEQVREAHPRCVVIAGPYWCLNLTLWCRGLADLLGMCLGSSYRYNTPYYFQPATKSRVAVMPLRRPVVMAPSFRDWLGKAASGLPEGHPAKAAFTDILGNWVPLSDARRTHAKMYTATRYREWLDLLLSGAQDQRLGTLYSSLNDAYVLGCTLRRNAGILKDEAAGKAPGIVAQQHMLTCLPS